MRIPAGTAWITAALVALSITVYAQGALFYCPMHPEVTATAAGTCIRCAMALVPGDPYDMREYRLEVDTTPRAPKPGEPVRLRMTVKHPSTRGIVHDFATVHEKPYHLFVISHDLESYDHVHPEAQPDGSWTVDVTPPSGRKSENSR
jgi:predicted membrane channel-forming protein YqfA (hemolysin III family)